VHHVRPFNPVHAPGIFKLLKLDEEYRCIPGRLIPPYIKDQVVITGCVKTAEFGPNTDFRDVHSLDIIINPERPFRTTRPFALRHLYGHGHILSVRG